LPKVVNAEQVQLLADVINELEIEQNIDIGHTAIIAQIEDVNAMPHLDAIASSSPRMIGMTIGSEDFATSASMKPIPEALFVLKQQVLMACRRANIMPLGFPASIADYSDMQHFKAIITLAKNSALLALFVLILLR
jgi:citrate lyase subunit beta/citryl-CoA lyase